MLAMQYSHHLDDHYDMTAIERRVAERGPLWDNADKLVFKAFIAQRRGSPGASGNRYASLYLWQDMGEAADFITDSRFEAVIASFGRPRVETWLPLDARQGRGGSARTLYREESAIDSAADLGKVREEQRELNKATASNADIVAVVTVLDAHAWRLLRFTLASGELANAGQRYEVLHLARPGLAQLP